MFSRKANTSSTPDEDSQRRPSTLTTKHRVQASRTNGRPSLNNSLQSIQSIQASPTNSRKVIQKLHQQKVSGNERTNQSQRDDRSQRDDQSQIEEDEDEKEKKESEATLKRDKLGDSNEKLSRFEVEILKLRHKVNYLSEQHDLQMKRKDEILEQHLDKLTTLRNELDENSEELKKHQKLLQKETIEKTNLLQKYQETSQKMKELKALYKTSQDSIIEANQKMELLKQERTKLQQQPKDIIQEKKELEVTVKTLDADNKRLAETADDLITQNMELFDECRQEKLKHEEAKENLRLATNKMDQMTVHYERQITKITNETHEQLTTKARKIDALNDQIEEYKAKIKESSHVIKDLENQNNKLERELLSYKEQISRYIEEQESVTHVKVQHADEISKYQKQFDQILKIKNQEIKELDEKILRLEREQREVNAKLYVAEHLNTKAITTEEKLKKKLTDLEIQHQDGIETLEAKHQDEMQKLHKLYESAGTLAKKIQKLTEQHKEELDNLTTEYEDERRILKQTHEKELNELKAEHKTAIQKAITTTKQKYEDQINEYDHTLAAKVQERHELASRVSQLEAEKISRGTEERQEERRLKQRISQLIWEKESLSKQIQDINNEKASLLDQFHTSVSQIEGLESEIRTIQRAHPIAFCRQCETPLYFNSQRNLHVDHPMKVTPIPELLDEISTHIPLIIENLKEVKSLISNGEKTLDEVDILLETKGYSMSKIMSYPKPLGATRLKDQDIPQPEGVYLETLNDLFNIVNNSPFSQIPQQASIEIEVYFRWISRLFHRYESLSIDGFLTSHKKLVTDIASGYIQIREQNLSHDHLITEALKTQKKKYKELENILINYLLKQTLPDDYNTRIDQIFKLTREMKTVQIPTQEQDNHNATNDDDDADDDDADEKKKLNDEVVFPDIKRKRGQSPELRVRELTSTFVPSLPKKKKQDLGSLMYKNKSQNQWFEK